MNAEQSSSSRAGSSQNMIAILEANLELYEILLDELKPDDLNINFLREVVELPKRFFGKDMVHYQMGNALCKIWQIWWRIADHQDLQTKF